MLAEICAEIRNYFCRDADKHIGTFEIKDGVFAPPLDFLKNGQYVRIVGSALNDGVYKWPASNLTDEEFTGGIWPMNVPPDFLSLAEEIETFAANDKPSAFASESFGGYSYSRATNENGLPATWCDVFATRLNRFRRVRI